MSVVSTALSDNQRASNTCATKKAGGFLCVDLKPFIHDATCNLSHIGCWSYSGLSWDIWKRNGVPFWYPAALGDVFVAGEKWSLPARDEISSAESGGVAQADHQQPGNSAIANANDNDLGTYWYAGDNRPGFKPKCLFLVALPAVESVTIDQRPISLVGSASEGRRFVAAAPPARITARAGNWRLVRGSEFSCVILFCIGHDLGT
jgi:hypothetical protein